MALSPDSNVSPADVQKGLNKSCPEVVLTMDSGKADFILSANVDSRVIDGTVYEGRSGYALFNSSGDLVFSTKTRYSKNAIKDVCRFIETHPTRLGGQFKSGQLGSFQNRPTGVARNC